MPLELKEDVKVTPELETEIVEAREVAVKAFLELDDRLQEGAVKQFSPWYHGRVLAMQHYVNKLEELLYVKIRSNKNQK